MSEHEKLLLALASAAASMSDLAEAVNRLAATNQALVESICDIAETDGQIAPVSYLDGSPIRK